VHIYDSAGNLAESESWQKPHFAAAHVSPKRPVSGTIDRGSGKNHPNERTYWSLAYGFR